MPQKLTSKNYNFDDPEAKKHHIEITAKINSFSLMFTLNKFMYSAPLYIQHNESKKELRKFFKSFVHDMNMSELMITPELTKDLNIHWHCYGTLIMLDNAMDQRLKNFVFRNKVMGNYYKFTMINGHYLNKEALLDYPFKDTKKTMTLCNALANCRPIHTVYRWEYNNLKDKKMVNTTSLITIAKFIEKLQSNNKDYF